MVVVLVDDVVVETTDVVLVELVVEVVGRPVVVDVVVVTGHATQHGMLGSCWIVGAGMIVAPVVTGAGGWRYLSRFWSPAVSVPAIVIVEPACTMFMAVPAMAAPAMAAAGPCADSSAFDSTVTVHPERKFCPATKVPSTTS